MHLFIAPIERLLAPAPAIDALQLYDAGPGVIDRWVLVHPPTDVEGVAYVPVTSFSDDPTHPQGVWSTDLVPAKGFTPDHLGRPVTFDQLPAAVQAAVRKEILE